MNKKPALPWIMKIFSLEEIKDFQKLSKIIRLTDEGWWVSFITLNIQIFLHEKILPSRRWLIFLNRTPNKIDISAHVVCDKSDEEIQ